jgi:diguanylate cyclase (GGDEF)-like protein
VVGLRRTVTMEPSRAAGCRALDAFPEPVVTLDPAGLIKGWNRAASRLFELGRSAALGRVFTDVIQLKGRDSSGRFPERQWAVCGARTLAVEVTRWSSADGDGGRFEHLCLRDASDRLATEKQADRVAALLRRQARSDALTGLANRYELDERLTAALAEGDRTKVALVVIDLDGFKPINDSFGHGVGDEVLAAVAARLRGCVREGDTVARLGGDEFVIVTSVSASVQPSEVTGRVRAALSGPFTTTAGPLSVGASVGIAVGDADSDASELLRRADKAMFRVKLARS